MAYNSETEMIFSNFILHFSQMKSIYKKILFLCLGWSLLVFVGLGWSWLSWSWLVLVGLGLSWSLLVLDYLGLGWSWLVLVLVVLAGLGLGWSWLVLVGVCYWLVLVCLGWS